MINVRTADKTKQKHRLIVVDDETDILRVLKSGIERNMNCEAVAFSDAAKALDHFRKKCDACDRSYPTCGCPA